MNNIKYIDTKTTQSILTAINMLKASIAASRGWPPVFYSLLDLPGTISQRRQQLERFFKD